MALALKPHTFTIQALAEDTEPDGGVLPVTVQSETTGLRGQITPKTAEAGFRATGLELSRPHKLLMDSDPDGLLRVGNRVLYGTRIFRIAAPIRVHDAVGTADHVSVMLDELDYAGDE